MSSRSARSAVAAAAALITVGAAATFGSGAGIAATTPPASTPTESTNQARLAQAKTFIPALGVNLTSKTIKALGQRDLVVVDGDGATAAQVSKLQAQGSLVLAYLSVGTVESWRPWFSKLKAYRLEPLGDWPGERYADTSRSELRDALADDIAPAILKKGFDGLFLDNVDMVATHDAQAAGMRDLVGRLSTLTHAGGNLLMAQNGDDIIDPYLPLLDAWNREDATGTYDFERKKYVLSDAEGRRSARATVARAVAAGVVATTTDYYASPTSKGAKAAIRISCKAGALPFVGDIDLEKIPAKPARC